MRNNNSAEVDLNPMPEVHHSDNPTEITRPYDQLAKVVDSESYSKSLN